MESTTKRAKLVDPTSPPAEISSEPSSKTEEPSDMEIHETDLPLLANVDKVKALHYLLNLQFDFNTKKVQGVLVLFLEPTIPKIPWETIVLDACSITVHAIYALKTVEDFQSSDLIEMNKKGRKDFYKYHNIDWFGADGPELNFHTKKWALSINGWNHLEVEQCPSVIRIHYSVHPSTASLNWRPTSGWNYDEGPKCVFTPASPVNNRGLFPCQEPPSAMATWECFVQTGKIYIPLLTSDEIGKATSETEDTHTHYFYSSMNLPMSTFAIVIGQFPINVPVQSIVAQEECSVTLEESVVTGVTRCNHDLYPCRLFDNSRSGKMDTVQLRLFSLSEDVQFNLENFSNFMESAIKSTYSTLGTYPFARMDLIILPKCFADLGLCNPNMIFLSPSLFSGDDPMYYFRIPHEISHFWFGLLIGALDWQEEFLSEGFATFMEDVLYKAMYRGVKDDLEVMEEIDTKACLRLLTLQNEMKNTDSELHVLSLQTAATPSNNLKNGLVPIKSFMQVHYLKGYFLLKYLSYLVGEEKFLLFLKTYVQKFHGQLVTSEIFFQLYFETFSEFLTLIKWEEEGTGEHFCIEDVQSTWLRSNNLPEPFKSCDLLNDKPHPKFLEMFPNCQKALKCIQIVFGNLNSNVEPDVHKPRLENLTSSELVLFLEKLITVCANDESPDSSSKCFYESLINTSAFKPMTRNPEIIHRFCELIILNKDKGRKNVVESFLQNHLSLGVYLYGELMISEKIAFQKIARRLYKKQIDVLDSGQQKILREMIF